MKLILCANCGDVIALRKYTRFCECGSSSGHYIDNLNAKISGECIPLGIANNTLKMALREPDMEDGSGNTFTAFVIPQSCTTIERIS